MQADITIFLPVYNGANYITQAIESVLKQTYQNWKFLIVDNCSTDNTAEICKPYLADPRFKYILNEKNLGVHGNFHKALGLCDTKYYAYLSHDDLYVRPDAFDEARKLLEADNSLAMINTPLVWIDQFARPIQKFGIRYWGRQGKIVGSELARASVIQCRNLYGVALLARTALGQKLRLDARLHQASDVNYFVGMTGQSHASYVYVIDKPAYAVRFHQTNNTLRQYATLIDEMNIVAQNNNIQLSFFERLAQYLHSNKVKFGKWVFYFLLNRRNSPTQS